MNSGRMDKMNLPPGAHIPGPMAEIELAWLYEQARKMTSIIEIGSLRGRSTFALLSGCPGPVHAVDIWESEAVYKDFIGNMAQFPNLVVHRSDSIRAASELPDAEMIFIDRTPHEYEDVSADIRAWEPKAMKLICGHDYAPQYPGVIRAVKEYFGPLDPVVNSIWYKFKNPK